MDFLTIVSTASSIMGIVAIFFILWAGTSVWFDERRKRKKEATTYSSAKGSFHWAMEQAKEGHLVSRKGTRMGYFYCPFSKYFIKAIMYSDMSWSYYTAPAIDVSDVNALDWVIVKQNPYKEHYTKAYSCRHSCNPDN